MIYRNKKLYMLSIFFLILFLLYIPYRLQRIEYRIFGTIGFIWASVLYLFAIFEYYKIDDKQITHVYRLGFKRDTACWKDIGRVFVISESLFKAIRMDYGTFCEKSMIINSGIKGYKELVKIIYERTKDNPNISIDIRVNEFLNR